MPSGDGEVHRDERNADEFFTRHEQVEIDRVSLHGPPS